MPSGQEYSEQGADNHKWCLESGLHGLDPPDVDHQCIKSANKI